MSRTLLRPLLVFALPGFILGGLGVAMTTGLFAPHTAAGLGVLTAGFSLWLAAILRDVGEGEVTSALAMRALIGGEVSLIRHSTDIVLLIDRKERIVAAGGAAARSLGFAPVDLRGRKLSGLVHEDDLAGAMHFLRGGDLPSGVAPHRWRVRRNDGGWRTVECVITHLSDDASGHIALAWRPLPDLPPAPTATLVDGETGLTTRALFEDRLAHALARAHRQQLPLAALAIEATAYSTNDVAATPEQAERLFVLLSSRLKSVLRDADTGARLGSSRLGVLFEDMMDATNAASVAERYAAVLQSPLTLGPLSFTPHISMGLACAAPEDTPDDVLGNAEVALRSAIKRGRGCWEVFDANTHVAALGQARPDDDLIKAFERGEFRLVYQPIVVLRTRRIAGVEALLRWEHPTRGRLTPSAFLAQAERTGLVVPLGRWILKEACSQAAEWQRSIGSERPITMTVNVSPTQLADPTFVSDVERALAQSQLSPQRLVLEIRSRLIGRDPNMILGRMRELRLLGVRVAIDDFGALPNSLGDPGDLPVDILKIDRTIIGGLAQSSPESATTRALVAIGKLKRLRTVAAGVEQESQVDELLRLRCEYAQGELFSEPLSADELLGLLARD